MNSIFKKISKGEIRGWVKEEIEYYLRPPFFGDPLSAVQEMGGKVIKSSTWRTAVLFPLPNGKKFFFKSDRTKGWAECVKYLFLPSKGQKEFFIASRMKKSNLSVPEPLGWMERIQKGTVRESYYLSEAIGSGVSFIDEPLRSKDSQAIVTLAKTVKRFQSVGLFHQDLHGGNFLWDGDTLFLTDLHRAKIVKALSQNQRFWNLAHLLHSLRSTWGETEQFEFMDQYFGEIFERFKKREILVQKIYPLMDSLQQRQWRSRTKRCLKESTEFTLDQEKGIRYFHRRDFSLGRLKRAIEEHRALITGKPSCLIKQAPEVAVSILNDRGEKICLKQFCYPRLWDRLKEHFRRSKGVKSWVGANGLRVRGIPSLKPLALAERRNWLGVQESFLLMEALMDDQEMDRYILRGFRDLNQKRLFIKTFAHWLAGLHRKDLYHRDMKTCNLLIWEKENAWDFHLLDFEDLQMDEAISQKRLFRNLLQLNTSTPKVMTKTDRFRFFKEYLSLNPIIKNEGTFIRRLVSESRRRGLVYVSPQGVVMERWE